MSTIGQRIKQLRNEKGYTRKQFADYIDIPETTLRNYELGTREPGHPFVVQMAYIFDVSTDYLLGITEERRALKENDLQLSEEELKHIKKYRHLNRDGKEIVDMILEREFQFIEYRKKMEEIKKD